MNQSALGEAVLDYDAARQRMVDAQIRPVAINDSRIIAAMRALPREDCVPEALRPFAYADQSLEIGRGRVLTEPRIAGRMVQIAAPQAAQRALVVGAGTGYLAALLARLELQVTALESDAALSAIGKAFCAVEAPGVTWVDGPLQAGDPAHAPFDLIVIDGAVREVPHALPGQLAEHGRIVCVIWPQGGVASACIAEPTAQGLAVRRVFDVALPLLPELEPAPAFAF
ncbi:protein-L-isoaspartate(D-aspartate) O-methyltransferase [Gluconacetobacter diazotrophicus PA1 5]|nr:protein-L-isoaspartate O-methyltransferase [Gluconacetobacter diazotrophicus]ACI53264.1 protein-L-isoaspartate(D-aspartate) O-methyltransferase [Gluconacetobacter diazotrophicus PA1 5]MBB2155882.1 protein-L-isoaspartate O-methyltransferase [Gluconacetobacter diazotrophicus]TWB10359.1 protein-L-isoaspartate(D-aspartate) O-methyltransferase [Gluconacetobacter diazotrophicus]